MLTLFLQALQAILMDSIQIVDGNSNYTIDIVPFQEEEEENFVGVKVSRFCGVV